MLTGNLKITKSNREEWVNNGCKWNNPDEKPENWSLEISLAKAPKTGD